jgi:hypothetical protein
MFTVAHVRLLGPLQPAGRFPRVPDTPNPEIGKPSLEVNAMLMVCFAPTTTDTRPATEGVATTALLLPVGRLPPVTGSPGEVLLVVVELLVLSDPLLLLYELAPQPDSSRKQALRSRERWLGSMRNAHGQRVA